MIFRCFFTIFSPYYRNSMISRRLIMIFDEDFEFSGLVAVSRHISEIGDEKRQNRAFSEGQIFAQNTYFQFLPP